MEDQMYVGIKISKKYMYHHLTYQIVYIVNIKHEYSIKCWYLYDRVSGTFVEQTPFV